MPCLKKGLDGIFRPLLICLIFFVGFSAGEQKAVARDRPAPVKEITVAVGQDYAPFYFRDQKGVADGRLVDLMGTKARLLPMLALAEVGNSPEKLKKYFE